MQSSIGPSRRGPYNDSRPCTWTGALSCKQAAGVITVCVAYDAIMGLLGAKLLYDTWAAFEVASQSLQLAPRMLSGRRHEARQALDTFTKVDPILAEIGTSHHDGSKQTCSIRRQWRKSSCLYRFLCTSLLCRSHDCFGCVQIELLDHCFCMSWISLVPDFPCDLVVLNDSIENCHCCVPSLASGPMHPSTLNSNFFLSTSSTNCCPFASASTSPRQRKRESVAAW